MIRTIAAPVCPVCGQPGAPLHGELRDALFAAPGTWSLRRCEERQCGTAWLDPRPVAEDLGEAYTAYYTHATAAARSPGWRKRAFLAARRGYLAHRFGYRAGEVGWAERALGHLLVLFPDLRARIDLEAFHLPVRPGGRFLEIGCGAGDHLAAMVELGWDAQGIDVDPAAVATARSRSLHVTCGEVGDAGFAAHSFDAIGLSHVIEHVDDPLRLLRVCRSLLRPDGSLVLVTPNTDSFGHARYGRAWLSLDPPRHLRLFTPAGLDRLVRAAGFARTVVTTGVRDAHNTYLASRSIQRCGRWTWGDRGRARDRLASRLLHARARWHLRAHPGAGEEIILVASG
ncbi:MAG: class I SAM-dependent methyltransferase [Planctomycetota bacterium]